jgi:hypothetical protein
MSEHDARKPETLKDDEIVSVKKSSRRKLLASMGVGVAAVSAATLLASAYKARASDSKKVESDKTPPKIDPDRD